MKPDFIGIGAQKCASTWLHRVLSEHPEVGVPAEKEVDFFSHRFDHGYQWYERRLLRCELRRVIGEISPSYFTDPAVPARVYRYAPEARILVSLRDPVMRALSNHRHEVRVGHFTGDDLSFAAGLANNPMYVEQGRYATHLKRWLDHFPESRILVLLMEDVATDPEAVAKEVFEFLGVDGGFKPRGLTERYNGSHAHRYRALAGVKDGVYRWAARPGLRWMWTFGVTAGLRTIYRRVNVRPSEDVIPQPDAGTLADLRSLFEPEIRELSELIGRPLEHWCNP